jgi:hypothetical protein
MRQQRPYAESEYINPTGEEQMNSYLNAAAATEHNQQLIADAARFRRSRISRISRKTKAVRRRHHR